jgi:hypothetical protein
MSTRLRQVLIALALFLMLMPLLALGFMSAMGRVRMGTEMSFDPRLVAGQDQYQGATYCRTCHEQEYGEWRTSLMANATTEALFEHRSRQLAWMMSPDKCLACHAPLERAGVISGESISCEVCHGPGRTEAVARNFCVVCHGLSEEGILTTGSEYTASPASQQGKTCETCHMPVVDGRPSHRFAGSRSDPESYRGVVIVQDISREADGIAVTVRNTVEGHWLPTGAEVNIIYLEVTGYDAVGDVTFDDEHAFEKSVFFMGTMPMQITGDNRLEAGEVRRVLFETGERPGRVRARIMIRPVGLDGKRREFVIHEQETTFTVAAAT